MPLGSPTSAAVRQNHPAVCALVRGAAAIIPEQRGNRKTGLLEATHHLRYGERTKCQREAVHAALAPAALGELLIEDRQAARPILAHRLDERHVRPART